MNVFSTYIGNNRIVVFCYDTGDSITTLKPLDVEYRRFSPSGIMVDNKGYVYVCDEHNKKVIVLSDISTQLPAM